MGSIDPGGQVSGARFPDEKTEAHTGEVMNRADSEAVVYQPPYENVSLLLLSLMLLLWLLKWASSTASPQLWGLDELIF